MSESCNICNGTGKVVHREPPSAPEDFGNGVTVQCMGGSSTRACACVRDLPPIDGKATWWDQETIYHAVVTSEMWDEAVEISCRCEVPRREDGRRVHRTAENFCYSTTVDIEGPEKLQLLPADARKFAAALVAAADACERADVIAERN